MGTKIIFVISLVISAGLTNVAYAKIHNLTDENRQVHLSDITAEQARKSNVNPTKASEETMCRLAATNLQTFLPRMMKLVEDSVDRSDPKQMSKYTKFRQGYSNLENASTSQLVSDCKNDKVNQGFYNCAANAKQTELFIVCVSLPRTSQVSP